VASPRGLILALGSQHMDRRLKKRLERYLAKQVAQSSRSIRSKSLEDWFDLWHIHPDLKSRADRIATLVAEATIELLQVAEEHFVHRASRIQAFAILCESTGDNAVYLHTENPNGSEFPYAFSGVVWGVGLPGELSSVSVPSTHEIGRAQYQSGVVHLVRARA